MIGAGLDAVLAKTSPDEQDNLEIRAVDKGQATVIAELIKDLQANRALKSQYATKVYRYLVGYSVFCGLIIFFQGWHVYGFDLYAPALTVLIGSTAIAAIGLVGFVVQGLFRTSPSQTKNAQKKLFK